MRQHKQSNAKTLWGGVIFWTLFSLAVTLLVLATPVHAADDNTVSITVNPAAQLTQQGDFYKATTNVTVKTSKPYGFDLTMKADGNGDLVNTVDPSHRISNMQNDSGYRGIEGIPANSWGYYMYDWHHNITVRPVYGHVPAAKDNETTLLSVTAAEQKGCSTNHSNCSKDVVFAANIDPSKLASGSYSASIMYTATARLKPAPAKWTVRTAKTNPSELCQSGNANSSCLVDLDLNMIPVKYTGTTTNAEWTSVADPEADDSDWYNYGKKQWANAITVKPEALAKYKGYSEVIDQADILGFWVYIPRYAYEVMRRDGTDKPVKAQNFDIKFENTNTPKKRPLACKTENHRDKDYRTECGVSRELPLAGGEVSTWATHPAFSFGKKELNGIWFAKFETTGTNTQPTVLPNEAHMSGNYTASSNIGRMYTTAKTLGVADSSNVGGNTDYSVPTQNNHHLAKLSSHMVNNNDWGAATYLSASKYGAGYNKVQINANGARRNIYDSTYGTTGCGPQASGNTSSYYDGGTLGTQSACSSSDLRRAYNGTLGQLASTTNNPTGIYDMSGGGREYTASSYTSDLNNYSTSYFSQSAHPPYVNTYNFTDPNSCTFTTCGGQALYETNDGSDGARHQWNGNYMQFVFSWYPWSERGGVYHEGSVSGLFSASGDNGHGINDGAFRVALAPTV